MVEVSWLIIIEKFNKFWSNLFKKKKYKNVIITEKYGYKVSNNDTIILVKKSGVLTWAKFKCPCKCGTEVILSLSPNIKPYWSIEVDKINGNSIITLSPSVHLSEYKCKSHFFLRKNKVSWVNRD